MAKPIDWQTVTCEQTENEDEELVRFGISTPAFLVRVLDVWRKGRGYANRSEVLRDLVRDALVETRYTELADHLISMKYVLHGKFILTTPSEDIA